MLKQWFNEKKKKRNKKKIISQKGIFGYTSSNTFFISLNFKIMKVKIYGAPESREELLKKVQNSLEELGLSDFIEVEETHDEKLKTELSIEKEPALIVEEESIDFKDTIFEGMIPSDEEIKSMFISIIGGGDASSCAPGGCGSWCSC